MQSIMSIALGVVLKFSMPWGLPSWKPLQGS